MSRHLPRVTALWIFVCLSSVAPAKTLYVDADKDGTGGLSWSDAFNEMRDAVAVAENGGGIDSRLRGAS